MDECIKSRAKDISVIVNSAFNTNYTETTINEIIVRLNNGEMSQLFHTYDVDHLLTNYISSAVTVTVTVTVTEATLMCLKSFTNTCIKREQSLETQLNRYIDLYDTDKVITAGVYCSFCTKCHYAVCRKRF